MRFWKRVAGSGFLPLLAMGIGLIVTTAVSLLGIVFLGHDQPGGTVAPLVAAWGVITLGTIVGLCLLWRRFRCLLGIGSALRDFAAGEREAVALEVCGSWGETSVAWNELIGEKVQRADSAASAGASPGSSMAIGDHRSQSDERRICDVLWHGIVLVDPEFRVRYCNGPAAALLNSDRKDLTGRSFAEVVDDERLRAGVESVNRGEVLARQTIEVACDGEDRRGVLRFGVRPLPDRGDGVVIVIEDITQQRAADEARNAFVAQVSHELRSPLTNMRLYVDTLSSDSTSPEMRGQAMNILTGELRRLERIVADMLSVAEIESGSLEMQRDDVRVNELLSSLVHEFEQQAEEKGVTLEIVLPPKMSTIQADRDKIALTLHNIVNNALKYTTSEGRVTVTVEESEGELLIEVRDTGIGISEEDLPRVFERFYRARDSRLEEITGSGLGLSIAREIVRRHGGEINVESCLNEGSAFTVQLPLHRRLAA